MVNPLYSSSGFSKGSRNLFFAEAMEYLSKHAHVASEIELLSSPILLSLEGLHWSWTYLISTDIKYSRGNPTNHNSVVLSAHSIWGASVNYDNLDVAFEKLDKSRITPVRSFIYIPDNSFLLPKELR